MKIIFTECNYNFTTFLPCGKREEKKIMTNRIQSHLRGTKKKILFELNILQSERGNEFVKLRFVRKKKKKKKKNIEVIKKLFSLLLPSICVCIRILTFPFNIPREYEKLHSELYI